MTYKIMHDIAPENLKKYLILISSVSKRQTRQTEDDKLYVPKNRLEMTKRSFFYRAVHAWNSSPLYVRCSPTLDCSKELLNQYLTPGIIM